MISAKGMRMTAADDPPRRPDPLQPGEVGPEVPVGLRSLRGLVLLAAPGAVGARADTSAVVWRAAGNELLVRFGRTEVRLDEGIVVLQVPVHCDEVTESTVTVAFAVGERRRPAGLLAITEERPRGAALVVEVWGDALTAFAWQVVLSVVAGVAAGAGVDTDGAPLIPAGLSASADELRVLTMARHPFDRAAA